MSSPASQLEAAVFESVVPHLEAEGFQVFVHPSPSLLPMFMKDYRPDAVALKRGKNIAIEVVSGRPGSSKIHERHQHLREMFSDHGEWELRVFFAPPGDTGSSVKPASGDVLRRAAGQLPRILEEGGSVPALLTAWATFEAAGRHLVPDALQRPQPAARLLEVLASDGYLTPGEAGWVRRIGHLRNMAAHGDFDVVFTKDELAHFVGIVLALLDLGGEAAAKS
ncbi:MAG: hypothetical protein HQL39_04975 [Alphaproteobacteria bacterium]|nr:hypothetical protein [Alphaproteobacteria bacterium]